MGLVFDTPPKFETAIEAGKEEEEKYWKIDEKVQQEDGKRAIETVNFLRSTKNWSPVVFPKDHKSIYPEVWSSIQAWRENYRKEIQVPELGKFLIALQENFQVTTTNSYKKKFHPLINYLVDRAEKAKQSKTPNDLLQEIPPFIHQVWLDKKKLNSESAHPKYDLYRKSFQEKNPDFIYTLWNRKDVIVLFRAFAPWIGKYEKFYKKLKFIEQCDFARFMILSLFGGFYFDCDFICLKNLSPVQQGVKEMMFVVEPPQHGFPRKTYNSILASAPLFPFWKEWLNHIVKEYVFARPVHNTTGPCALRRFLTNASEQGQNLEDKEVGNLFREFHGPQRFFVPHVATWTRGDLYTKDCLKDKRWNPQQAFTTCLHHQGAYSYGLGPITKKIRSWRGAEDDAQLVPMLVLKGVRRIAENLGKETKFVSAQE